MDTMTALNQEHTRWLTQQREALNHTQALAAERRRAEAQARAEQDAEVRAAAQRLHDEQRQMQAAVQSLAGDHDAYVALARHCLEVFADRHNITIRYEGKRQSNEGTASPGRRLIRTAVPTSPDAIATLAHEIAHHLIPRCSERGDHLRVTWKENTLVSCLRCEADVWEAAFRLVPFTAAMADGAAESLRSYFETPATPGAKLIAERVISGASWRADAQRRQDADRRAIQLAEINEIAADIPKGARRHDRF